MLSGIATIFRVLSGFIVTKIIAVYAGPSGLAIVGQLQNFVQVVLLFSGDVFKTATTKYTAEYVEDKGKKYWLWSSTISIVAILNILTTSVLYLFSDELSEYLLSTSEYGYILKILAISVPFFVLNTLLMSILNGQRQINMYISLNIALSLISLFLVVILSINYGIDGVLVAYVTNQSVVFIITIFVVRKESWFKLENFTKGIKLQFSKKIFGFAIITLFAILSSNISLIYIRDFIMTNLSKEAAGYWQGVWVLSQVSIVVITTSLTTYILPKISSLGTKKEISSELNRALALIFPIAIFISASSYFFRDFIIYILYSNEFTPMRDLFLWQMIATVFKIVGWLYGYVLVAKAMVRHTVFTEVFFASTFVGLSIFLMDRYGLIGVTYAYAANSLGHMLAMYYIYKFRMREEHCV
jgi:polysaccharide transporter, PST family